MEQLREEGKRYWKTPAGLYAELDREFGFDFDPCPCPCPDGFDGMAVAWGRTNFVNPPFRRRDAINGHGPTAFARRAIAEAEAGHGSVLLLPVQSYVGLLGRAGAGFRFLGRVRWKEVETGEPMPRPQEVVAFVLRGKE